MPGKIADLAHQLTAARNTRNEDAKGLALVTRLVSAIKAEG